MMSTATLKHDSELNFVKDLAVLAVPGYNEALAFRAESKQF